MRKVPRAVIANGELDNRMLTPLRGKSILIVERQPLVAADIEDRLLGAGTSEIVIASKPGMTLDMKGFDALIVNASQDSDLAHRALAEANASGCAFIVLHDDLNRAQTMYPGAAIVEIPFDSESILKAVAGALADRIR